MSGPGGYRRLLVSKDLVQTVLIHGTRCCVPVDVPKDIRIVTAGMVNPWTFDFLVASKEFPEHLAPGETDTFMPTFRQVECGRMRMDAIAAAVEDLRERYLKAIHESAHDVYRPWLPTANETIRALEDILELAAGQVEDGPADAPKPRT